MGTSIINPVLDFALEVARGNVSGVACVNGFGHQADLDTAEDPADVWPTAGLWVPPTTARTHDIASSDANDTAAGSGARTVKVEGLDAAWALQEETVTMNGTTNVPTASTYVRIFRMRVLTDGTEGQQPQNVGSISATAQTDVTVTAVIAPGRGQTEMAIYTVPAAKALYLTNFWVSLNRSGVAGSTADFDLLVREDADTANTSWAVKGSVGCETDGANSTQRNWVPYFKVAAKSDIKIQVLEVSANNSDISAGFDGYLVDD